MTEDQILIAYAIVAARPAEPTGELREQVESALIRSGVWPLAVAERAADALLAGPLAPLLAKLRAVEALAAEWETARDHYEALIVEAARELRSALTAALGGER